MEVILDTDLEFVEKWGSGALQTQTSGDSVAVEISATDEVHVADERQTSSAFRHDERIVKRLLDEDPAVNSQGKCCKK